MSKTTEMWDQYFKRGTVDSWNKWVDFTSTHSVEWRHRWEYEGWGAGCENSIPGLFPFLLLLEPVSNLFWGKKL